MEIIVRESIIGKLVDTQSSYISLHTCISVPSHETRWYTVTIPEAIVFIITIACIFSLWVLKFRAVLW